jgi:transposase-like protein
MHRGITGSIVYCFTGEVFISENLKKMQDQLPACVECLERNRNKLFTFLEYDGIPWNNNNAEHAMKAVAMLRDVIESSTTEKGMREYLVLLSICQTCKYQGPRLSQFSVFW